MDVRATSIYRLVIIDHKLVFESYDHVSGEGDPERLILDHRVPEGSRGRVHGVIVGGIANQVIPAAFPSDCTVTEPDGAIRELLAVVNPVRVAPPAVVDRIAR